MKEITSFEHKNKKRKNIATAELRNFKKKNEEIEKAKYERNESLDPQLIWKKKSENDLELENIPIYVNEKIDPKSIIKNFQKQKDEFTGQGNLFSDFEDDVDFKKKIEFYEHEQRWSNRLILGDSSIVMNSLLEKEYLGEKVQTIFIDPPYGIKFASNWQVSTKKTNVTHGKKSDINREPEVIKAFRDTWHLGIHSYLNYLRDRLVLSHRLLDPTGSIFVQIGDENIHLVRSLLDEIFGMENFISQITFRTNSPLSSQFLGKGVDFILWYAKDKERIKFRSLFVEKDNSESSMYRYYENKNFEITRLNKIDQTSEDFSKDKILRTSSLVSSGYTESCFYDFEFKGRKITRRDKSWKPNQKGMERLIKANRLAMVGKVPEYKRYFNDFPVQTLSNNWTDTFSDYKKLYVVQTPTKVIERCILMTSDPGDLILDPTCGGGTTAYVSEKFGRRWITIDSSRVSLCLTRIRLMSAYFDYYKLNDKNNLKSGFEYKKVKHIQLRDISRNENIDPIFDSYKKDIQTLIKSINKDLDKKLDEYEIIKIESLKNKSIQKKIDDLRKIVLSRDSEIEKNINENSGFEVLYDKPLVDNTKVRVTGKFTVESLSPNTSIYDTNVDGKVSDMEHTNRTEFIEVVKNYLEKNPIKSLYKDSRVQLENIENLSGGLWINLKAETKDTKKKVAIFIGPETGTLNAEHVKECAKEATKGIGYEILYVLGFSFDPYVVEVCKEDFGNLKIIPVRMNNDLQTGLREELKNTGTGNIFMVFGEPDIKVIKTEKNKIKIIINGLDVYDPTTGSIRNNPIEQIACWFIDTDYDGESFYVKHAYFVGNEKEFESLKKTLKLELDLEEWSKLNSTESIAFEIPKSKKIALKVINNFGDEILKVYNNIEKEIK